MSLTLIPFAFEQCVSWLSRRFRLRLQEILSLHYEAGTGCFKTWLVLAFERSKELSFEGQ